MLGTVGPGRTPAPESISANLWVRRGDRGDDLWLCGERGWRGARLGRRVGGTGGRSGFARCAAQLTPLLFRQAVVLLPLLFQPQLFVRRQLFHLLVALARGLAFLGGELGPGLHAPLHARLFVGFHLRITLGDTDPLALALRFEIVPVDRKRRERLLLLLRQLAPRRGLFLRCSGEDGKRGAEPKCYCEERFSHASNPLSR